MENEKKCKVAIEKALKNGTGSTVNGNPIFDYKLCGSMQTFKKVFNEHFSKEYCYSDSDLGIVKGILKGTGMLLIGIGTMLESSGSSVEGVVIKKK